MTDSNALLKEFTEAQETYRKLVSQKGKLLLGELFKNMFAVDDQIQKIKWSQYTPYFADGDPCEFGVNEFTFLIAGVEPDEEEDYGGWAELVDPTTDWFKKYCAKPWGSVSVASIKKLMKVDKQLRALDEDVFKETFGDHSEITASLDDKGKVIFKVEECEHE